MKAQRREANTPRLDELEQLAPYLDAIRRYRPLGREEERALASRSRAGDQAARYALVRHNLALVVAVARRRRRGAMRLDDLVQEGSLGLLRAVEKFDPSVGTRFSTYATWWIRAYVGRHIEQASAAVRPVSGARIPVVVSLDAPFGDGDAAAPLDRVEDDRPTPEDVCLSSARGRRVRDSVFAMRRRLGPVAWDIVKNRLERDPPESLADIGRRWGLSRERVRQVELQTREFLRRRLARASERDGVGDAA